MTDLRSAIAAVRQADRSYHELVFAKTYTVAEEQAAWNARRAARLGLRDAIVDVSGVGADTLVELTRG